MQHFVRAKDGRFVVNCRTHYALGWNHWELLEAAAGGLELFGASLPPNTTGGVPCFLLPRCAAGSVCMHA